MEKNQENWRSINRNIIETRNNGSIRETYKDVIIFLYIQGHNKRKLDPSTTTKGCRYNNRTKDQEISKITKKDIMNTSNLG